MDADDLDLRLGKFNGDLDRLLAALEATEWKDALLELDGSAVELHDFVEARSRHDAELLKRNRKARKSFRRFGPLILGGRTLALPIEGDNLRELRMLAEGFAEPEIAICLSVRGSNGTLLLDAPDLGDDEIWVNSRGVSVETIQALRQALGPALS